MNLVDFFTEKTDAPDVHQSKVVAPASSGVSPLASVAFSPLAAPDATVPDDDSAYKALLAKTDIDSTPLGKAIAKYAASLSTVIADPVARLKAAIAQAQSLDGINEVQIRDAFGMVRAVLAGERDAFGAAAQAFMDREIAGRHARIEQINQQISQFQDEQQKLSHEIVDAESRAARGKAQFESALQRRSREIEEKAAQFGVPPQA